MVVDHQDRGRQQAERHAGEQRERIPAADLHGIAAGHGDRSEEDEDQQIAQAEIAQRPGPAGVGDRAEHPGQADRDDRPAAQRRQIAADRQHQQQHQQVGPPDQLGRDQPLLCHARRTAAGVGVGAVFPVVIVVGQVGRDLQQQGASERGERRQRPEAAHGESGGRSDDDRHRPGRQRARPDCLEPDLDHGSLFRLAKSGARFSRKALRPSCASSVM